MLFGSEEIKGLLAEFDRRELYIQEQLARFQAQATTGQARCTYATVRKAFSRERREMRIRRPLLLAILAESESEKRDGDDRSR